MPRKSIDVMGGRIYINWPENSEKFLKMYKRIHQHLSEANEKVRLENEKVIDSEFRKKAAKEFDGFFGKGSCIKVFGTERPSYKAFVQFIEKFEILTREWK